MLHRIYFTIEVEDKEDIGFYKDADIPQRVAVGERLMVDKSGWDLPVESVTYSLSSYCYETELLPTQDSSEETRAITKSMLVKEGWIVIP